MKGDKKKAITAVIIEDVEAARNNLADMLKTFCPSVNLVGMAATVVEGLKLIRKEKPEILFLDIELGDETAFDLLDFLPDMECQVIFTTGSREYAIRAFRYAAIDYLLKPIDPDELVEAVERHAASRGVNRAQLEIMDAHSRDGEAPERIALKTLDKMYIIGVSDIQRCEADGNYTIFHIEGRSPILVTRTLKDYDRLLKPAGFLRVHQSHLVSISWISEFVKVDGGYVVMKDGAKIPVSTRRRAYVVSELEKLS